MAMSSVCRLRTAHFLVLAETEYLILRGMKNVKRVTLVNELFKQ